RWKRHEYSPKLPHHSEVQLPMKVFDRIAIRFSFSKAIAFAAILLAFAPQRSYPSASANDNAGNDNIGSGNNGATGFPAWSNPQPGGGGGVFTGTSTANANTLSPGIDTSSKSWGMYCNGSTVGANFSRMTRLFTAGTTSSSAMQPGQTFTLDMDNGFVTTSG